MQAIQTKYIGPSETKGARIKAWCAAGSLTVDFHSIDAHDDQHRYEQVAMMLRAKLGWDKGHHGDIVTGCLPNGDYCHVFTKFVSAAQGVRDMIREGTPSGNPHCNPAYRTLFQVLADHRRVDYNKL